MDFWLTLESKTILNKFDLHSSHIRLLNPLIGINTKITKHRLYIYSIQVTEVNDNIFYSKSIYIKESRVSYTIYKSRTAEPIWLKIGGEVA